MTKIFATTLVAAAVIAAAGDAMPAYAAGVVGRPSISSAEIQGNGDSLFPTISSTGRFVAFVTSATNMVSGDTNAQNDIMLRDRMNGTTARISISTQGSQANGGSERPTISGDGRYVAFDSTATNLTAGDTNGHSDVFVRDRSSGTTKLVSVARNGAKSNGYSQDPTISSNGRYVIFESAASNLTLGDANNNGDVFLRDLSTNKTTLVSIRPDGKQFAAPSFPAAITADGRYVGFGVSPSTGYWLSYIRDRQTGTTTRLSVGINGAAANGDVFLGGISTNGRFVVLTSTASNLVVGDTNGEQDVFVRDLTTGATTRVSLGNGGTQPNGGSGIASISADGRYVAFASNASNLVVGDNNTSLDVFVYDRSAGNTKRVSVNRNGVEGIGTSENPEISADGKFVAFDGNAALVSDDTNGLFDVFAATVQ